MAGLSCEDIDKSEQPTARTRRPPGRSASPAARRSATTSTCRPPRRGSRRPARSRRTPRRGASRSPPPTPGTRPPWQSSGSVAVDVAQGTQTISFAAPARGTAGGSTTLSATGGASANAVVFSLDPSSGRGPAGCQVTPVSYTGAGNCVIDANQAANADYSAAPQVTQTILVRSATTTTAVTVCSSRSTAPTCATPPPARPRTALPLGLPWGGGRQLRHQLRRRHGHGQRGHRSAPAAATTTTTSGTTTSGTSTSGRQGGTTTAGTGTAGTGTAGTGTAGTTTAGTGTAGTGTPRDDDDHWDGQATSARRREQANAHEPVASGWAYGGRNRHGHQRQVVRRRGEGPLRDAYPPGSRSSPPRGSSHVCRLAAGRWLSRGRRRQGPRPVVNQTISPTGKRNRARRRLLRRNSRSTTDWRRLQHRYGVDHFIDGSRWTNRSIPTPGVRGSPSSLSSHSRHQRSPQLRGPGFQIPRELDEPDASRETA